MNPFEFSLAVLALIFMFTLLKTRMGVRHRLGQPEDDGREAQQLRNEVRELKDRIKVLERITVEKENSLSRQIEELRDR